MRCADRSKPRKLEWRISNWRWSGVPFYLRTGKRMAKDSSLISIRFKHPPQQLFRETQIEEIEAVYWEDLMPECLWQLRVKGLRPLTVAMDAHGGNLYAEVAGRAERRLQEIFGKLGL